MLGCNTLHSSTELQLLEFESPFFALSREDELCANSLVNTEAAVRLKR